MATELLSLSGRMFLLDCVNLIQAIDDLVQHVSHCESERQISTMWEVLKYE